MLGSQLEAIEVDNCVEIVDQMCGRGSDSWHTDGWEVKSDGEVNPQNAK